MNTKSTQTIYAWLIEFQPTPKSMPLYFRINDDGWGWTSVIDLAMRFSRKEDAENVHNYFFESGRHKIVEHGWS